MEERKDTSAKSASKAVPKAGRGGDSDPLSGATDPLAGDGDPFSSALDPLSLAAAAPRDLDKVIQ